MPGHERSGEHVAKEWSLFTTAARQTAGLTTAVIGGVLASAVGLLFANRGAVSTCPAPFALSEVEGRGASTSLSTNGLIRAGKRP